MSFQTAIAGDFRIAQLFSIVLEDGTEVYLTTAEDEVTFLTKTYVRAFVGRTESSKETDLSTGQIKLRIAVDDTIIDSDEIVNEFSLDNAVVKIYIVDLDDVANYTLDFKGVISDVNTNNNLIEMTVRNQLDSFDKPFPRKTYNGSACPFVHGDTDCGITLGDFDETGTADSGSDADTLVDAARVEVDEYFQAGVLTMTSGDNNGRSRVVLAYSVGTMTLMRAFPNAIAIGDTYSVRPYCRQTFDNCDTIFSNSDRIGLFANIPKTEEIY